MKMSLKEFFVHEGAGTLKEYEDPTSSKDDSSKWSSPLQHKGGMPEERPQTGAQENSSEAWEETHKSSGQDAGKLKGFFKGEPFPKKSVSEAGDEKMGSGKVRRGKMIDPDEMPDELPDELGGGEEKPDFAADEDEPGFDEPEAPAAPKSPEDADAAAEAGDEIGTGVDRSKFIKDMPKTKPPAPSMGAVFGGEPKDSFEDDFEPFDSSQVGTGGIREPSADDMTWDEFRVAEPEAAQELERDIPDESEREHGFFQKKDDGRVYFVGASGQRMTYLGDAGWADMDDGETPAGEF